MRSSVSSSGLTRTARGAKLEVRAGGSPAFAFLIGSGATMSEINDAPRLTQTAFDRLQTELDELRTSGRKTIAERLQRARELGDLSENAEYHETKNQQGMM